MLSKKELKKTGKFVIYVLIAKDIFVLFDLICF